MKKIIIAVVLAAVAVVFCCMQAKKSDDSNETLTAGELSERLNSDLFVDNIELDPDKIQFDESILADMSKYIAQLMRGNLSESDACAACQAVVYCEAYYNGISEPATVILDNNDYSFYEESTNSLHIGKSNPEIMYFDDLIIEVIRMNSMATNKNNTDDETTKEVGSLYKAREIYTDRYEKAMNTYWFSTANE